MLNVDLLTLEEKIKLLSGKSGDIVAQKYRQKYLSMSDGPHGVRSHGVCYPNMCLIAGSWDKDVLYQMGRSIGNDCIAEGVDMFLTGKRLMTVWSAKQYLWRNRAEQYSILWGCRPAANRKVMIVKASGCPVTRLLC